MKLLKHAQHGWKYATDAEALADMANGWTDAEDSGIVAAPKVDVEPVASPTASAEPVQRARPGPKPKHKG